MTMAWKGVEQKADHSVTVVLYGTSLSVHTKVIAGSLGMHHSLLYLLWAFSMIMHVDLLSPILDPEVTEQKAGISSSNVKCHPLKLIILTPPFWLTNFPTYLKIPEALQQLHSSTFCYSYSIKGLRLGLCQLVLLHNNPHQNWWLKKANISLVYNTVV